MIDAGPLVRIKQALTRLKAECTQMDVRIGVVRECSSRESDVGCSMELNKHFMQYRFHYNDQLPIEMIVDR